MNEQARLNVPEWTVSELSAALKKTVEDAFGYVRVRGEISGYRGPHSSGHCYFALKDPGAKIEAVIWKTAFGRMRLKPEEGLEVFVTGRLTTYPGQSKYQIVIETLEPAGLGALMALVEERKKKLAAEGLFDAARKQLLPFLPERDRRHHLADRRRHPRHFASACRPVSRHVLVWPVRVQGEGSAEEVAAAIAGFNALLVDGPIRRPDLLIVARGGGSLEDLWSFNDEIVVRAAAASMIPLISAVGHETDVTLIDFAADMRAPTPTAAAETGGAGARGVAGARRRPGAAVARPLAALPGGPAHGAARGDPRPAHGRGAARAAAPAARSGQRRACRVRSSPMRNFITGNSPGVAGRLGPQILTARMSRCCELVTALVERAQRAEERRAAASARTAGDRDRPPGRGLAGQCRRPSQSHRPAARARRRAGRAQRACGARCCFDTARRRSSAAGNC